MDAPPSDSDSVAIRVSKRTLKMGAIVIAVALVAGGAGYGIGRWTSSSHNSSVVTTQTPGTIPEPGASTTSTAPSTTPAPTTSPPTTMADFSSFAGFWYRHDTKGLTIDASGHGSVGLANFTACPNCSYAGAPTNTITFTLKSISNGDASGTVISVTDPNADVGGGRVAAVGDAVNVSPVPPGQLQLNIGGTDISTFCGVMAPKGECGA